MLSKTAIPKSAAGRVGVAQFPLESGSQGACVLGFVFYIFLLMSSQATQGTLWDPALENAGKLLLTLASGSQYLEKDVYRAVYSHFPLQQGREGVITGWPDACLKDSLHSGLITHLLISS